MAGKTMAHYMRFHEDVKAGKVEGYRPTQIAKLRNMADGHHGPKDLWHFDATPPDKKPWSLASSSYHDFEDLLRFVNADGKEKGVIEDAIADANDEPPFGMSFSRDELMAIASLAEDLLRISKEHHAGIIAGYMKGGKYKENPVRLLLGLRMLKEHVRPEL